jgi:hypothetical protein
MRLPIVRAAILCLFCALSARAESANERLFRLNSMVSAGLATVDIDWSGKTASQQAALARAEDLAVQVKTGLSPDLQSSPLYGTVVSRLAELNVRLGPARSGVGCSVARDEVIAALEARDETRARKALDDFGGHLRRVQAAPGMARAVARYAPEMKTLEARHAALEQEVTAAAAAARQQELEKARAKAAADAEAKRKSDADAKAAAEQKRLQQIEEKKAKEALERAAAEERKRAEAAKKTLEREAAEQKKKEEAMAREQARLEKQRLLTEKQEQARAEREAKIEAERGAKEAAAAEKERERNDPRRALNNVRVARDTLLLALREKPGPLPEKAVAVATAAVAELRRLDPERAIGESALVDRIMLRSFARAPSASPPLGTRIVTKLSASLPRATFDVWDGWCYALVSSSEAFFRHSLEANTALVSFRQSATTSSQLAGFCSERAGQATLTLEDNASKANVLVLGWSAAKLPLAIALHAGLTLTATCDEVAMAMAWRSLLPGSVLFATPGDGGGPVLVLDTGFAGNDPVRVLGSDGIERQLPRNRLRDTPVTAPMQLAVPATQCPEAGPRLRVPPDPEVCRAASDAAASQALASLSARLTATTDDVARGAVERELRALDDEARRRRMIDCVPVEESPVRAWRVTQHDAVYKAAPAPTDRARSLALEAPESP